MPEAVKLLTGPPNSLIEAKKERAAKLSKYKRMRKVYDHACQNFRQIEQQYLRAKREYEQADRKLAEQTKLTIIPAKKEPKQKQKKQNQQQTEKKKISDIATLLAGMSEEQVARVMNKIKQEKI